jgi:hypothetical protein
MSDAEDQDDSSFDEEAERERLREKYEREQEKREVTERMSELLLQGATMTNAHCSDCGDPVFRYDGQEFCATCEKPVQREVAGDGDDAESGDAGDDAGTGGEGADDAPDQIEVTTPGEDARVRFGDDQPPADDRDTDAGRPESGAEPADSAGDHRRHQTVRSPGIAGPEGEGGEAPPGDAAGQPSAAPRGPAQPAGGDRSAAGEDTRSGEPRPRGSANVEAARGSLRRTLTRFARQAEATDDPREAEASLSAAREAAETLSAIRR